MRLFPRRNKSEQAGSGLPPEVKEYYETGKRERKSIAWLLAVATLIATIVVVFGAFLGGRWVYRKIANSGKEEVSTTQNEQTENGEATTSEDKNSSENQPEDTPTPSPNAPAASTPSATNTPAPSSTPQSGSLPSSGPRETVAVFAVATIAGATYYQIKLRRKYQN